MAEEKSESATEGFYELNGVMVKDVAGIPMTVGEIAAAYMSGAEEHVMTYLAQMAQGTAL